MEIGLLAGVRTLLDVGAGNGFRAATTAPACTWWPPITRPACSTGTRARPGTRSASQLPFGDGTAFDVVGCWELLHHLDDPVSAVRDMYRVARRRVVMFEPNRINPGTSCSASRAATSASRCASRQGTCAAWCARPG
jgi:SAM-dependent methyltransferase